jgi:hypothetical protein
MVTPIMKIIVLIPLIIVIGCILTTGCVGQIKNETVNLSTLTPTQTFAPFSNTTNPSNVTIIPTTSGLKGPLRVSIGGWDADLPVFIDNTSIGVVTHDKPLDLMLEEGNHTVKVCAALTCEEEVVTIKFAKQRIIDFEGRLIRDVEFAKPTARIVGYYPSGDMFAVTVEFINPSIKDLSMTAEIKCSYTYIESRSNSRVGSTAQGIVSAYVQRGNRVLNTVDLNLASGYSYIYSIPTLSGITVR